MSAKQPDPKSWFTAEWPDESSGSKQSPAAPPLVSGPGSGGIGASLAAAVGATAGVALIVYVAGAALLRIRFGRALLPQDQLISALPREYLAVIGIRSVLLPALLAGAACVFVTYVAGRKVPPRILAAVGCALALAIPVGFAIRDQELEPDEWSSSQTLILIGGLATGGLGAVIALKTPRSRPMVIWLVGACAVVAMAGYRAASEWGEPLSLAPVRVLMNGDEWADAYFIAANPQQIVLALGLCDPAAEDDRQLGGVLGVPQASVRQVVMADTVKVHDRGQAKRKLTAAIGSARRAETRMGAAIHSGLIATACR